MLRLSINSKAMTMAMERGRSRRELPRDVLKKVYSLYMYDLIKQRVLEYFRAHDIMEFFYYFKEGFTLEYRLFIVLRSIFTRGVDLKNGRITVDVPYLRNEVAKAWGVFKHDSAQRGFPSRVLQDQFIWLKIVLRDRPEFFIYCHELTRQNKEIVKEVVARDELLLSYASEELKNDVEFMLEMVCNDGMALEYASEEIRSTAREVVLAAVRSQGTALQWAIGAMREDQEIVLDAIGESSAALYWASRELKYDREFLIRAVNSNASAYEFIPRTIKRDRDFLVGLLQHCKHDDIIEKHLDYHALLVSEIEHDHEILTLLIRRQNNGKWIRYLETRPNKHYAQVVMHSMNATTDFTPKLLPHSIAFLRARKPKPLGKVI